MDKHSQNTSGQNIFLPEKRILVEDNFYCIHGLVHGTPWIRINPSFKREVNRQLKDCDVLCEDGFASWIPGAVSMEEGKYFKLGKLSFFEKLNFWKSILFFYLPQINKKEEPEIISKVRKMTSIEDLIEIRKNLFNQYLSEPEGINLLMKKGNSGTIDFPKGNIPLCVRRYIYEAKTALEYAHKKNIRELHLVVGCAHERPLEYLLSNKNVLDKYSL